LHNKITISGLHYVDDRHKPFQIYCQLACNTLGVVPRQKDDNLSKARPEPVHGKMHLIAQPMGKFAFFGELLTAVLDIGQLYFNTGGEEGGRPMEVSKFPFEEETGILLKYWEYCYERSLGCVGVLHRMLVRAVHSELWAGEKTLRDEYLRRHALSAADCDVMLREIHEGEREFAFNPGNTGLRQMLGLKRQVTSERNLT
jgi:hypothetical protein